MVIVTHGPVRKQIVEIAADWQFYQKLRNVEGGPAFLRGFAYINNIN